MEYPGTKRAGPDVYEQQGQKRPRVETHSKVKAQNKEKSNKTVARNLPLCLILVYTKLSLYQGVARAWPPAPVCGGSFDL
jgi:hypothetical protein